LINLLDSIEYFLPLQEIEKELEDDKPEGEAALQELFNKIYQDADDDTR
jgi:hypothetical protein